MVDGTIEPALKQYSETQVLWTVIRKLEMVFEHPPTKSVSRRQPEDFERLARIMASVLDQYRYAADRLRELGEIK